MTMTDNMCPNCGTTVYDRDICPSCGADILDGPPKAVGIGEEFTFEVSAEDMAFELEDVELDEPPRLELELELCRRWSDRPDRTTFAARPRRLAPVDKSFDLDLAVADLVDTWYLVEDLGQREATFSLPQNMRDHAIRFRTPIGESSTREGRQLLLYRNREGITLEQFVELQNGALTFPQVKTIFEALLEAVSDLHGCGYRHLRLAPSRIRIAEAEHEHGIPESLLEPAPSTSESTHAVEVNIHEEPSSEWEFEHTDETQPQDISSLRDPDSTVDDLEPVDPDESSSDSPDSGQTEAVGSSGHWLESLDTQPSPSGGAVSAQMPREKAEYDVEPAWVSIECESHELDLDVEIIFEAVDGVVEPDAEAEDLSGFEGYAPPELYRRTVETFEPLIDVFSLGSLLYFMIAGRCPPTSVYTRHTPALPARNFRLAFPPGCDPVIKRSTRPDPESRYPDLASMANAFEEAAERIEQRHTDDVEPPRIEGAVERHIGIGKREQNPVNQDDVFRRTSRDGRLALMVVADGVSTATYGSGDIASAMVVREAEDVWDELIASYVQNEPICPFERVDDVIQRANECIVDYVNEHHTPFSGSPHEVMGTTALVALYHEGRVTLASVGDSRTYLQRGPGLEQLTIDHNLWTLSILNGMSADDSLSMPQGDALARCVGTFEIQNGTLRPTPPGADVVQFPIDAGDKLLLTTDGLIDFAGGNIETSEENILATLLSEPNPDLACLELVLLANRGGGGDNIGVGIADFE